MNKKAMKKLLGIVVGGTLGAILGMVFVLKVVASGDAHTISSYGQHGQYFYPIGTVAAMVLAALGYFMANTLTSFQPCGKCGGDNPLNAIMCQFCGNALDKADQAAMVCPSCHGQYSSRARYCPMCAVELKSAQEIEQEAKVKNPPVTKECSACGATNMPQRTACHKCGKPV